MKCKELGRMLSVKHYILVQSLLKLNLFCSSVDDGLLTPNSTVDNITREFAAVLQEETSSPACKVSPSPQNMYVCVCSFFVTNVKLSYSNC